MKFTDAIIVTLFIGCVSFFAFDKFSSITSHEGNGPVASAVKNTLMGPPVDTKVSISDFGQKLAVTLRVNTKNPFYVESVVCRPAGVKGNKATDTVISVGRTLAPKETLQLAATSSVPTVGAVKCSPLGHEILPKLKPESA